MARALPPGHRALAGPVARPGGRRRPDPHRRAARPRRLPNSRLRHGSCSKNPHHVDDPGYARRVAETRGRRAQNVFGRQGSEVCIVLDEAALVRQIGGPETMAKQVEHLRALDARPNVSIRVLPFTAGAQLRTRAASRSLSLMTLESLTLRTWRPICPGSTR